MIDPLDLAVIVEPSFEQTHGKVPENVKNKFKEMLEQVYGFTTMYKINGIFVGKSESLGDEARALDSNNMALFKHTSLISCDVEITFSQYKTILSDNCTSFTFENLETAPCDPLQCSQTR
jgi:hypothetical protein